MSIIKGRLLNIFLGSMLGDGHVTRLLGGRKNPSYVENHALDQEAYLRWKMSFWEAFGLVSSHRYKSKKKSTHQDHFGFTTRALPELLPWREAFYDRHYPTGRQGRRGKHFPEEVIPLLTPLGLAVWYMDDGGAAVYPYLSCHPRNHEVGQAILAEFGLMSRIKGSSDSWRIDVLDVEPFLSLVKPHIHPDLLYKLLPSVLGEHAKIPTDEFLRLSQEKKLSLSQLSEHFGFASRTIEAKANLLRVKVSGATNVIPDLAGLVKKVPRDNLRGRRIMQLPKDVLKELLQTGHSLYRLSNRFGVSEGVVRREIERLGLAHMYTPKGKRGGSRNKAPHITKEALAHACKSFSSISALARHFQCSRDTIQSRLNQWGLRCTE